MILKTRHRLAAPPNRSTSRSKPRNLVMHIGANSSPILFPTLSTPQLPTLPHQMLRLRRRAPVHRTRRAAHSPPPFVRAHPIPCRQRRSMVSFLCRFHSIKHQCSVKSIVGWRQKKDDQQCRRHGRHGGKSADTCCAQKGKGFSNNHESEKEK